MNSGFNLLGKYRTQIMGFAALWIIAFHYWDPFTAGKLRALESVIKGAGFCGVDIFLLLSGYGLFYSMEKSDKLLPFYKKRLARLWFPVAVIAALQAVYQKWDMVTLLKNALGYNFYAKTIYSFLWFVYLIAALYLLFPFYYRLFRRAKNKTLFTGVVFCVWLGASLLLKDTLRYDFWGATNRIPVFLLGVLYGHYSKRENDSIPQLGWTFVGITLSVGAVLCFLTNWRGMHLLVPNSNCCIPNLLIAASLPLIMSEFFELLHGRVFDGVMKALRWLGSMSFELYCVQELVRNLLRELFPNMSGAVWNLCLYVCVILGAAAIYYIYKLCSAGVRRLRGKEN